MIGRPDLPGATPNTVAASCGVRAAPTFPFSSRRLISLTIQPSDCEVAVDVGLSDFRGLRSR